MPVLAQAQELQKPPLRWKTTATTWQLDAGSGPALNCTKKGPWPEQLDYQLKGNGIKTDTVFQCGGVVLTRSLCASVCLGSTGDWSMKDKTGKPFGLYASRELDWINSAEPSSSRQVMTTTLKGGWGGVLTLLRISTGKLVPMPQPVFR